MARVEQDREDLLQEAVALVERAELAVEGFDDTLVIGFRRDGCASVYFGPESAWHFNTRNQLRRAFVDGLLYKAQRGQLVALERRRTEDEVQLLRDELSPAAQEQLLARLTESISLLRAQLAAGRFRVIGQVAIQSDLIARIRNWLDQLATLPEIADVPNAR